MRELLADNITLLQQLETMQGTHPVNMIGPTRPRLREVSTLTTWLYCSLVESLLTIYCQTVHDGNNSTANQGIK